MVEFVCIIDLEIENDIINQCKPVWSNNTCWAYVWMNGVAVSCNVSCPYGPSGPNSGKEQGTSKE